MKTPLKSAMLGLLAITTLAWQPTSARAALDILHAFSASNYDYGYPNGSVTLSGSKLYGMTSATAFSMNTDGTSFDQLHIFNGGASNGGAPLGSLTLSGSSLYGMTYEGGVNDAGTIFTMNTDGTGFNQLHSFLGGDFDGNHPFGSLTLSGSKLYGMASQGGFHGTGVIFSMNTDGTDFGVLHSFASDNAAPLGSLTLSGSKLYGMTLVGGDGIAGSIFSINTDGTGFNQLHSFLGGEFDGRLPYGSLTLSGSTLYGMSSEGGSSANGTIFSIGTDGTGFGLLHSFTGGASDGRNPSGSLTLSGSTLYGMSYQGGSSDSGTLFSIGTDGTGFDVLESLTGGAASGAYPTYGDVTFSGDGSTLYGMTSGGGVYGAGTVFSLAIAPVPEPGTACFGIALLGLSACRRRRTHPAAPAALD